MTDRRLEGMGRLVNDVGWAEPPKPPNLPYILKLHMELKIGDQTCVVDVDGEKATVRVMYP